VTVTLIADLGLPLHSYQLALNHPEHSAMYEVSWCVGLYVSVLLFEFLPVFFEGRKMHKAMALWQRWSGAYVVIAATLFVFMLSRNWMFTAGTFLVFGAMQLRYRTKFKTFEPILLAIAAVTLSTMHQSSLGSLFLLMPDKVAPQWWSPVMPVSFFLSAIAAGTALIVLIEMWIARAWRRPLDVQQVASMGKIAFGSLLVYLAFRLGDMAVRKQFDGAFDGRLGLYFGAEIVVGGIVPLVLLASASLRNRPQILFLGTLLTALGVVFNRINVVYFAMRVDGPMPYTAPRTYSPSLVEWGISLGLIAATIFLFGMGIRYLPLLPKRTAAQH
jgi:formate dehydrogenase iron-sulfur subunit